MTAQLELFTPALEWNPRYVAYADAHGYAPTEQVTYDRARFPGGHMGGFTTWIAEQWREFGIPSGSRHITDVEQDEFTAWLAGRYSKAKD